METIIIVFRPSGAALIVVLGSHGSRHGLQILRRSATGLATN